MKFIKQAFGKFNKFNIKMITSVRFSLSYDPLNMILSTSNFVYFNEKLHNLHCCNRRRHDVTCSHHKFYVTLFMI